jgi:hypothetical protein
LTRASSYLVRFSSNHARYNRAPGRMVLPISPVVLMPFVPVVIIESMTFYFSVSLPPRRLSTPSRVVISPFFAAAIGSLSLLYTRKDAVCFEKRKLFLEVFLLGFLRPGLSEARRDAIVLHIFAQIFE